jgi:hypothetical protein
MKSGGAGAVGLARVVRAAVWCGVGVSDPSAGVDGEKTEPCLGFFVFGFCLADCGLCL